MSSLFHKYFIFLLLFSAFESKAQLSGKITDEYTKETIPGATIHIEQTDFYNFSGFDGSYNLKDIPKGTYSVSCSFIGFETQKKSITISTSKAVLNFELKTSVTSLNEVTIEGRQNRETESYSLNREKNSDNILNSMGAKTIELLPDLNAAGVLNRMSGVSLDRSNTGNASYAIIRGMNKRYNYTLVNGLKIPSPDDKNRYVPMDVFPADLLGRVEVIKALTPSMEGDAIGGAMNLILKTAPDSLNIHANIGTGFNSLIVKNGYTNFDNKVVSSKSPSDIHGADYVSTPNDFTYNNFDYSTRKLPLNTILGFSIGNRFLKDKKLGVLLSASYQNQFSRSNDIFFKPSNQPEPGNVPAFVDYYKREYNTNNMRLGLHSIVDYRLNKKNTISLYNIFLKTEQTQFRNTIDTSLSIGRSGVGTGNTYKLYRSLFRIQSILNSALHGNHEISKNFKIDWSGSYSKAKSARPDWSEYQTVQVAGFDVNNNPTITEAVLNIPFYRIWTNNSDIDYQAYLNFHYRLNILSKEMTFSFGGLYRDKTRFNNYNEWNLIPKTSTNGAAVIFNGTLSPNQFVFNGESAAQGRPKNPLNYDATEKIKAYYIQDNILLTEKLSVLGGIRIEQTDQTWKTAQDPKITYGAVGEVNYTDFLPSVHFKYSLTSKQNLRLSYFSAINRPGFYEYIPFTINGDNFTLSGNPQLKRATSSNFDFRYEIFPGGLDEILIGGFFKNIRNPIESAIKFTGTSSATLQPRNFGTATNYGFEITLIKYYGKFGVSTNYTYTNSKITTSKLFYNESFVAEQTTQTRPLQGQSPHIANAALIYKNQKSGLDVKLALTYTGRRITFVSPYKDLDYWQKGTTQLDFSLQKKFYKHFILYAKISNLLNTPVLIQILQPNIYTTGKFALPEQNRKDRVTVQKDYYGQNFTFGIRYKL